LTPQENVSAGAHYGEIRADLQARGQIIGNNDLWLAAHARSRGWILVTNNLGEFNRVPDLKLENWA
jgi:tRNA(fMet)-specific endonuclease VapC